MNMQLVCAATLLLLQVFTSGYYATIVKSIILSYYIHYLKCLVNLILEYSINSKALGNKNKKIIGSNTALRVIYHHNQSYLYLFKNLSFL